LAPAWLEALIGQIGIKLFNKGVDHARLCQGFPKQPDRLRIGHALIQIKAKEPHTCESNEDRFPCITIPAKITTARHY
jgi:hypothetical protein